MRIRLGANPYRDLEKALGYAFRKRALLETALVHRSHRFEVEGIQEDNQRMEFLGDAVLGLVAAEHIYQAFGALDEGALTDLRSRVTSGRALAQIAREIGLGQALRLGRGEENSGGRHRPSVLADALEAVIGAAYLDRGLKAVERIFSELFVPLLTAGTYDAWAENPKGQLQEITQRTCGQGPVYRIVREEGPSHGRVFTVEAVVEGRVMGTGTATTRREAESQAARQAVEALMQQRPERSANGT